jgi:hypothetical protein
VGVFVITLGIMVCNKLRQPQNYIEAVDPDSVEMKTAELLSGIDGNIMLENEFLINEFWNFPMRT